MKVKNDGITLIALIITIIVMLILVSVSITTVIRGGLFQKAGEGVGSIKNAVAEDNKIINNDFGTSMQANFEEMAESVSRNKGFYVGRYETSNMTTSAGTTVKVISWTRSGIINMNWYYMYAQQKEFADNNTLSASIGRSMIWGSQYDQVMKFINEKLDGAGNTYNVTTSDPLRHTEGIANAGNNTNDLVQNIYDLEGNFLEMTMEANDTVFREQRGGMVIYSDSASIRTAALITFGSRLALYIK